MSNKISTQKLTILLLASIASIVVQCQTLRHKKFTFENMKIADLNLDFYGGCGECDIQHDRFSQIWVDFDANSEYFTFSGFYTYGYDDTNTSGFMDGEAKFIRIWDAAYALQIKEELIMNFKQGFLDGKILYKRYTQEIEDEESISENWKKVYSISADTKADWLYFRNLVFMQYDENQNLEYVLRQQKSQYISIYYCEAILSNQNLSMEEKPLVQKIKK